MPLLCISFFFFQAEDGIRDLTVTGVQTCALPIYTEIAVKKPHWIDFNAGVLLDGTATLDRKSTRLNSSHSQISYAVFCLKKKKKKKYTHILETHYKKQSTPTLMQSHMSNTPPQHT